MIGDITTGLYPVTELQHYLREISKRRNQIPIVNPDGIFGPETTNAVQAFQNQLNLPATGTVNETTWNHLINDYNTLTYYAVRPACMCPFPESGNYTIKLNDTGDAVYCIQIMINALSRRFTNFCAVEITGVYDQATSNEIQKFQALAGLAKTGSVNKSTWNALVAIYNIYK